MLNEAFVLSHEFGRLVGTRIPVIMLTDNKGLFDLITKSSNSTEKRFMLDICAARESSRSGEIEHIGLVPSSANIADTFTKPRADCSALTESVRTGQLKTTVMQWIVRKTMP